MTGARVATTYTRSSRAPGPIKVVLRPDVVRFLRSDVAWTDSVETGGGLYGFLDGNELVIEAANHASGPGRSSRHPDLQHDVILDYAQRLEDHFGWAWIGTWHVHPPRSSGNLSTGDCSAMAGAAPATRETNNIVVGVILHDPGFGAVKPNVHAYIADGHIPGKPVRIGPAWELIEEVEPSPLRAATA